jgi:DNA-binding NarL/FixJ family response regulator
MDAAQRDEILTRYREHAERFDTLASRRPAVAEVIALPQRVAQPFEQSPTAREIEVLHLVSQGLVNREIGDRLYLSEETVKSHVRHILAKLQARSRAHAVAVGFRRGLLT